MRSPCLRALPIMAAALLSAATVGAVAQMPATAPGSPDTKAIVAGTYKIEPHHTQVVFAIDHMGFSIFRGFLSDASGTMTLDPAKPTLAQISVSLPISSIHTTSAKLDEELVSPDWFDAKAYPTASFVSTKVTQGPNGMALVDGNLTLHGVTKPVQMHVRFHGAGANPMTKLPSLGFDARMMINRSDFGISKYVPLVSDHVEITIGAAFEKQ